MSQDYKVTLRDIVELFYHSPFKIFNINSVDGETMIKPLGYFISLGITTSLDQLRLIRDYISRSDYGIEAKLVKICSVKSDKYGDYLNTILPTPEDEITKYPSPIPNDIQILELQDVANLLREIRAQVQKGDYKSCLFQQKLNDVLDKIGGDWDSYAVQIKDNEPGVFHRYINYIKTTNSEYRIGIYATKL